MGNKAPADWRERKKRDTGDDRIKRLTANDIIGHFLKHKELKDLKERIQQIEQRLETRG